MSEKEKTVAEKLGQAFDALPNEKKEYLIGVADGIAMMAARRQQEAAQATVDMAARLGA